MPSIRDIIRGKSHLKKRNIKALVCVDYANWRPFLREQGIDIDWREFRSLMESLYSEVDLNYYDGEIIDKFYRQKYRNATDDDVHRAKKKTLKHFKKLKGFGYRVVSKPMSVIHQASGRMIFKCNFDVEITIDVMDNIDNYGVFVFCTGDGDFIALLKRLKRSKKETHVISVKGRANKKLIEAANHYDDLDKLLVWVQKLSKK